jgi:hypothetical protein
MQRPRRARRAVVFHDDRLANEEDLVKKKRLETSKKRRTNPHIPVPVEPLPDTIQETQSDPLPTFTPPFRVRYESFAYPFARMAETSILLAIGYL